MGFSIKGALLSIAGLFSWGNGRSAQRARNAVALVPVGDNINGSAVPASLLTCADHLPPMGSGFICPSVFGRHYRPSQRKRRKQARRCGRFPVRN